MDGSTIFFYLKVGVLAYEVHLIYALWESMFHLKGLYKTSVTIQCSRLYTKAVTRRATVRYMRYNIKAAI